MLGISSKKKLSIIGKIAFLITAALLVICAGVWTLPPETAEAQGRHRHAASCVPDGERPTWTSQQCLAGPPLPVRSPSLRA